MEGVALHGGDLPGYPASHGCIRLPREFAKKLYSVTTRGTTVIVVDEKHPQPTIATHAGILLANANSEPDVSRPLETEFVWNPERSAQGPITILASGADETVYVLQWSPIGRARFNMDNPQQPLGGHAFIMLEGVAETRAHSCRVAQRIVGWRCERKEKPRLKRSGGVCTSPRSSPRKFTISFLPGRPLL